MRKSPFALSFLGLIALSGCASTSTRLASNLSTVTFHNAKINTIASNFENSCTRAGFKIEESTLGSVVCYQSWNPNLEGTSNHPLSIPKGANHFVKLMTMRLVQNHKDVSATVELSFLYQDKNGQEEIIPSRDAEYKSKIQKGLDSAKMVWDKNQ